MCLDDEFEEEETAQEPLARNEDGIVICDKMWEICTVPGMWIYAEKICDECQGYNNKCRYYTPTVLE